MSEIVGIAFFPGNTTEVVENPRSLMSISILQLHDGLKMSMELKPPHLMLCNHDHWYHCNPPHQLHDDDKHVYTVILQELGDDGRNIIAIWNDWECWQPYDPQKWSPLKITKSSTCWSCYDHSMRLILVFIKHCKCMPHSIHVWYYLPTFGWFLW